eukprot:CAMPEP_0194370188 /NCGR_PEP_ID=MMETSP0174-20130528/18476_1 /TAXON_ID=216777 /ORGANISM="Proboscia alata, Strain PI-D3" /LENGTH=396 /DNA_ID=CAMNT_0039147493 /DNA_START=123 /DNA_END=1313 /DNA_ORIENTATION=+
MVSTDEKKMEESMDGTQASDVTDATPVSNITPCPIAPKIKQVTAPRRLTITKPDDFHHHFRDGSKTATIVAHASRQFVKCIVMPNLNPPVTNTAMALVYRKHILSVPKCTITPLMTLYLTDHTTPEEITKAKESGHVYACKYYPAGATTNSQFGVTDVKHIYPAIRRMAECGIILCIHSEVSTPSVDIYDREEEFIETIMKPLVRDMPDNLKIVMEHISTKQGVEYVTNAPPNVAASITAHHLLYNRNALLVGGIKPHFYCLPILKRETHRLALLSAATSGNPKFFLGTDSAPHETSTKESGCGCAGVYTAHAALELYAEAFDSVDALELLEGFSSVFGSAFYGLERNTETVTLEEKSWNVPKRYPFMGKTVTPLRAGEKVKWSIVDKNFNFLFDV